MTEQQVFVSYSHRDAKWAGEFAAALESFGVRVWIDQAFPVGDSLREALEKGLRDSNVLAVVIDPESLKSPSLLFEVGVAIGLGQRVVPIVPQGFDPDLLPPYFRTRRSLARSTPHATAAELLDSIGSQRRLVSV